jgi:hypothetical protein
MSSDRVKTRSKNTTQHPGRLVPKQARRTTEEVAAIRKLKEDAKKEKEDKKKAAISRVAEFELNQAKNDAMEETPRAQVAKKLKPLVRRRSYADVLRSSDVEMYDGTPEASTPGPFRMASVDPGQTTDDGMETVVQDLPPKKMTVLFFFPS